MTVALMNQACWYNGGTEVASYRHQTDPVQEEVMAMAQPQRQQIISRMIADLETLPQERLEEVRDFVEFLKQRTQPRRGSPAALLEFFGTWEGPTGELDQLVEEIYQARHSEE